MTTRNELEWSFAGWTIDRTLHAYLMGFGAKKVMALKVLFSRASRNPQSRFFSFPWTTTYSSFRSCCQLHIGRYLYQLSPIVHHQIGFSISQT